MCASSIQQADNAVQRRADVVAHAGEKAALGGVRPLGLLHRVFQLCVLAFEQPSVFLLCAEAFFLIRALGAPPEHMNRRQKQHVEEQHVRKIFRRRREHRPLGHIGVNIVVLTLIHQAELVPNLRTAAIVMHELATRAALHDALQKREIPRVRADKRLIVRGHDFAAAADDDGAVLLRLVTRNERVQRAVKDPRVLRRGVEISHDNTLRIPAAYRREVHVRAVLEGNACAVAFLTEVYHVHQRVRIGLREKLAGGESRLVVLRQNVSVRVQQEQSVEIACLRVVLQRLFRVLSGRHIVPAAL